MKLTTFFLLCCASGFLSLTAQVPDTSKYALLEPHDFHLGYLKTDPAQLIDVREPFEFKSGRIKGAINIPSSGNIERSADTLNHDMTYFLYCTTDYRSIRVAEKLYEAGFRKLVVLEGGIKAWRIEKMPTVKKKERGRERVKR
jgi:rhodanese-related sulfurtransferase